MTGAKAASNTFVSLSCWALKHDCPSNTQQCWRSRSHPGWKKHIHQKRVTKKER